MSVPQSSDESDDDFIRRRMMEIREDARRARTRCTECDEAQGESHAAGCSRTGYVVDYECRPES